jgi:hypothetical protein
MAFQKGRSGNPAGRPRGTPNKLPASTRQALEEAFQGLGGVPALIGVGKANPSAFYALWGRLTPTEVAHTGEIRMPRDVIDEFPLQFSPTGWETGTGARAWNVDLATAGGSVLR